MSSDESVPEKTAASNWRPREVAYSGHLYKSLKECWKQNAAEGLSYAVFRGRIYRGSTIEEALLPLRGSIVYNGQRYVSLKECWEKNAADGVSYAVFRGRISGNDMPIEKALSSLPYHSIVYNGQRYANKLKLVKEHGTKGLSVKLFIQRIKAGWPIGEALTAEVKPISPAHFLNGRPKGVKKRPAPSSAQRVLLEVLAEGGQITRSRFSFGIGAPVLDHVGGSREIADLSTYEVLVRNKWVEDPVDGAVHISDAGREVLKKNTTPPAPVFVKLYGVQFDPLSGDDPALVSKLFERLRKVCRSSDGDQIPLDWLESRRPGRNSPLPVLSRQEWFVTKDDALRVFKRRASMRADENVAQQAASTRECNWIEAQGLTNFN